MQKVLYENNIDAVVESAGTENWNVGQPADQRAIKIAKEKGINLRTHRARQLRTGDLDNFDMIIVMDRRIENAVRKIAPGTAQDKIKYMLEDECGKPGEILDPYFSSESAFYELYDLLSDCCARLFQQCQGKP